MTPEQKARELVDRFERLLGPNTGIIASEICCDEIMQQNEKIKEQNHIWWRDEKEYWESVKQHIQSL